MVAFDLWLHVALLVCLTINAMEVLYVVSYIINQ
jgi:hypothetical protein